MCDLCVNDVQCLSNNGFLHGAIQASFGNKMILLKSNDVNLQIMHSDLWNSQCAESPQINVVTMTTSLNVTRNWCLKRIYIYIYIYIYVYIYIYIYIYTHTHIV